MISINSQKIANALKFLEGSIMQAASGLGLVVLAENVLGEQLTNSHITMYLFLLAAAFITRSWSASNT